MEDNNQAQTIELMIKNEESISKLYGIYAQKIPEMKSFWKHLAEDELAHARWIRALHSKIKDGSVSFNNDRFDPSQLKIYNNFLVGLQSSASKHNVSKLDALETSVNVEKTMLEKNFFEFIENDSVEMEILLQALKYSTDRHMAEIKKVLSDEKIK